MNPTLGMAGLGAMLLVASGCAATAVDLQAPQTAPADTLPTGNVPRDTNFDFELVATNAEMDELEIDFDTPNTDVKIPDVRRTRIGQRFAFGSETARGFFTIFWEDWDERFEPDLKTWGIGGGVKGMPKVGDRTAPVVVVLPYLVQFAGAGGHDDITNDSLFYFELQMEVGVGVDWMGLRPTVGVMGNSIAGILDVDAIQSDATLKGTNIGGYGEIRYKPPGAPVYFRLRGILGNFQGVQFGVAFEW